MCSFLLDRITDPGIYRYCLSCKYPYFQIEFGAWSQGTLSFSIVCVAFCCCPGGGRLSGAWKEAMKRMMLLMLHWVCAGEHSSAVKAPLNRVGKPKGSRK